MRSEPAKAQQPSSPQDSKPISRGLLARSALGGVLMGLANLVPGVSGGTMLLAAGVYREFVGAIASVTRFKLGLRPIGILTTVAGAAALAILLGAGTLKDLVVHQRWVMYALFIGLTLGGLPLVWKPVKTKTSAFWIGGFLGLSAMVALFVIQLRGGSAGSSDSSFIPLAIAGGAGASAMILPGLSGGYLLLLLGQYVPILSGLDRLKEALVSRDMSSIISVVLEIVVPVGLGVVLGVVLISNLVQWFFRRYETATYGVLLGLLLGATVGLWPFQEPVQPALGDVIKGQVVTAENLKDVDLEDYPLELFTPNAGQAGLALLLVAMGCAGTLAISRLGSGDTTQSPHAEASSS